jgi:DNA-binding MarR family transcriptional regulator
MKRFRYSMEGIKANRNVGYLLHQAQKLARRHVEKVFEGQSLTISQWIALTLIEEQIATTPGEIAESLGHNSGATTRLVDKLESQGLIVRAHEAKDQRVVTLSLTKAGQRAVLGLFPAVVETWNSLLTNFDRDEVETLIRLLTRLIQRLQEDEK